MTPDAASKHLAETGLVTPAVLRALYPALAAEFPSAAIERTKGSETGKLYNTTGIKYQYVMDRFNEVLGPGHVHVIEEQQNVRETVTSKGKGKYHVDCRLVLALGNWRTLDPGPSHFDVVAAAIGYGGHESLRLDDARKGAFTNAFKKAAAMLGPGHEAYAGLIDDDNVPSEGDGRAGGTPLPQLPSDPFVIHVVSGTLDTKGEGATQRAFFKGQGVSLATGETFPLSGWRQVAQTLFRAYEQHSTVQVKVQRADRFPEYQVTSAMILQAGQAGQAGAPVAAEPKLAFRQEMLRLQSRGWTVEQVGAVVQALTPTKFDDSPEDTQRLVLAVMAYLPDQWPTVVSDVQTAANHVAPAQWTPAFVAKLRAWLPQKFALVAPKMPDSDVMDL